MKYRAALLSGIVALLLAGCSSESMDSINPAANNEWDMRLFTSGIEDDAGKGIGAIENPSDVSSEDGSTISRGDSNSVVNATEEMVKEIISSTLTDDLLEGYNKIPSTDENNPDAGAIESSINASDYIERYLNPKVETILSSIKANNVAKDYPSLYFRVLYRGIDRDQDGNSKWVTYTKSYQNLKESDALYGKQAVVLSMLANWNSINKELKNAYVKASMIAGEFGNSTLKYGGQEIFVRDCSTPELLSRTGLKENTSLRAKYINYYLEAISMENSQYKYSGYSSYMNSFRNSLNTSYSSAVTTALHIADVLPTFQSSSCTWISYAGKENSYDKDSTLTRRRIQAGSVSSAFSTSKSKNTNMGKVSMKYTEYSRYGGNVFYFENGAHKLAILVYGDNLWKKENTDVEQLISQSLNGFKSPEEFGSSGFA